jgi:hypothetical protein
MTDAMRLERRIERTEAKLARLRVELEAVRMR